MDHQRCAEQYRSRVSYRVAHQIIAGRARQARLRQTIEAIDGELVQRLSEQEIDAWKGGDIYANAERESVSVFGECARKV